MAQVIQVPVQFTDARDSAKALLDKLKGEISRYKPGTTIANQLIGDTKKLNALLSGLDKKFAKGIVGHSDIDRILTDFIEIERAFQSSNKAIGGAKFDELDLNFAGFKTLVTDLQDVQKELNKFAAQKDKIEKMSLGGLLGNSSKIKGMFSPNELSGGAVDFFDKITEDVHKYENALTKAQQKTTDLQDSLTKHAALNPNKQVIKNDAWALDLIQKNSSIGDLRAAIVSSITQKQKLSWDSKDNFTKGQLEKLDELLAPFGLDSATVEAAKTEAMTRSKALEQVVNTLTKNPNKHGGPTVKQVEATLKGSKSQAAWDKEQARLQKNFLNAQNQAANAANQIQQARNQLNTVSTALQQNGYLDQNGQKILINEIGDLTNRISTLEAQILQGGRAGIGGTGGLPNDDLVRSQVDARRETENFRRQGQALIKRWFGAYAIVNKVRQAVHQAWSDIQDLDKAMTNIAVVTDMSVSDLWGKINEYMSIAKQYGVTTQGVYEVSQLYYQQGLSTNEVMAATTETLKMARIAGMDYTEAADAMTVAIRAFKMEMSDAGHVTDVYSKVAAVTASDSEELAIAMSKTASSAESVGSSFENTTAMLAVMIETTRESAQNLGSALKSIISRYGEMKVGLTVDSEGEEIDYNKVDTALKSVGISIKDAQGQFRDFDDVIFELSERWDSLDKNTQRYIATIMAGNRQQSRFIALVDNWERLEEVANSAQDSEDAGLLQYAKTLDSLDTKINNLKTSFQEFYMSIVQGPAISKAIEKITKLFEGLNKQGTAASILNVGSIVSTLTIVGTLFVEYFSTAFGKIRANWQATLTGMEGDAARSGQRQAWILEGSNRFGYKKGAGAANIKSIVSKNSALITGVASLLGGFLTTAGTSLTASKENNTGAIMSGIGNALSYGAMGFAMAGSWGALIGAALGGITSVISGWRSDVELEVAELEKATKKAEEANIARAEAKNKSDTLEAELNKLEDLAEKRFSSDEAMQAWLDQNALLKEQFGQLAVSFDTMGNAIIEAESAEKELALARMKTAQATRDAVNKEIAQWNEQQDVYSATEKQLNSEKYQTDTSGDIWYTTDKSSWGKFKHGKYTREEWNLLGYNHSLNDVIGLNFGNADTSRTARLETKFESFDILFKYLNGSDKAYSSLFSLAKKYKDSNYDEVILLNEVINTLDEEMLQEGKTIDNLIEKLSKGTYSTRKEAASGVSALLNNRGTKDYYEASLYQNASQKYASSYLYENPDYAEIPGIQTILSERLEQDYLSSDFSSWQEFGENVTKGAKKTWLDIQSEFNLFWKELGEQEKAELSSLVNSISDITLNDFSNGLSKFNLGNLENDYLDIYYTQDNASRSRLANQLVEENLTDTRGVELSNYQEWLQARGELSHTRKDWEQEFNYRQTTLSYEDWLLEHFDPADTADNRAKYNEELRSAIARASEASDGILDFIANGTIANVQAYSDFIEREKAIQEKGGAAADVSKQRENFVREQLAAMQSNSIKGLDENETFDFVSYLTAEDAGTYAWQERGRKLAKQWDIELEILDSYIYESFNTRIALIADEADNFFEKMEEFSGKQENGFSYEEAESIAKQLEQGIFEAFKVEDGKLILKNFNTAFNDLYEAEIDKIEKLGGYARTLTGTISEDGSDAENWEKIENVVSLVNRDKFYDLDTSLNDVIDYLNQEFYNIDLDPALLNELASGILDGSLNTEEKFIAWANQFTEVTDTLTQWYRDNQNKIVSKNNFQNYYNDTYKAAASLDDVIKAPTLDSITEYAISAGTNIESEGGWKEYFAKLSGIVIDSLGNIKITDAEAFIGNFVKGELTDVHKKYIETINTQIEEDTDKAIKSITDGLIDDSLTSSELVDAINLFGGKISFDEAKTAISGGYSSVLETIQNALTAAQVDSAAASEILTEIAASWADALTKQFSSNVSSFGDALTGELSHEEWNRARERYKLSETSYRTTANGIALSGAASLEYAAKLYDEALKNGMGEDALEAIYEHVSEAEDLYEIWKNIEGATENYADLLGGLEGLMRFDENNPLFNFMDQDPAEGLTKSFDSMVKSIDAVKGAFQSLSDGESIDYKSFYNMMDFMRQGFNTDEEFFDSIGVFETAGQTYEQVVNGIVEASGEIGKVNMDGFAKFGISVESMAETMDTGLQKVAKDQIDYLKKIKATLEAFAELEKLEDINLSLVFKTSNGNIEQLENMFGDPQAYVEAYGQEYIQAVKEAFEEGGSVYNQLNNAKIDAASFYQGLFGEDGFVGSAEDINAALGFSSFFSKIRTLTEDELVALAQSLQNGSEIVTKSGDEFTINWKAFAESLRKHDWTSDLAGLDIVTQAKIHASVVAEFAGQVTIEDGKLKAATDDESTRQKIIDSVETQAASLGKTIEAYFNEQGILVEVPVKPEIKAHALALGWEFDEGFYNIELETGTVKMSPSGVIIPEDKKEETIAKMQAELNKLVEGQGIFSTVTDENGLIHLQFSATEAPTFEDNVAAISQTLADLKEMFESGVDIDVNTKIALAQVQSLIDEINSKTATITIKTRTIDESPAVSTPTGGKKVLGKISDPLHAIADVAGNVSGLALSTGNATDKLIAGAAMAGKTLVGELGPELAVYDGQYHLLGRNGAEFVNLPDDAIVFNHRQTKGIAKGQMGVRGKAKADGNVSGTALAGGVSGAIAAIDRAIAVWQKIADATAADLAGGSGGGGGSGNSLKAVTEELQEWYNLSRQIEHTEQEINNLLAKRENIADGSAYLRSLREEQALLREQVVTQQTLLQYQQLQLKRQADQINQNDIWSKFLEVDENGLLQYKNGNETNGGKGALDILQGLNEMSGEEQIEYLKQIGYSYTTADGEKLEGEDLVKQFFQEFQDQIDSYDSLYDTVHGTEEELEKLARSIKDVDEEIRDNRIELEEKIYDLVVEGWENNIEKMEEELDILSEANERYINGLSEALEKEKSLYDKNEATADREQLQRRLSLLRRSGGSASEIASLEEQLNDTLKDEYFQHQQEAIDKVAEASQTQIEKMEEQIQIQKDQLEFSKEHGLIWEEVNRILSGSTSEILEFIQGNDSAFIEKSATEIGKQLEEWSKKVGIFTEDRQTQEYTKEATKNFNADTLNSSVFNKASAEEKKTYTDLFASYFTNARMEGQDADAAYDYAYAELRKKLGEGGEGSDTGGNGGGNTGGENSSNSSITTPRWQFTELDGTVRRGWRSEAVAIAEITKLASSKYRGAGKAAFPTMRDTLFSYSKGGLVDYTGLAMVHGSKSRPESFLNAEQTAQITEALHSNGKNSVLSDVRQAVTEIAAAAKALVMNETNNSSSINVAPGAVVVKVEKLNDKYDIDSVADDIMNKMVSIASKATSRGVNRR